MAETVTIASRFRGPPESANGGYAAAMAARLLGGPAEVTLRRPPPLDRPLMVRRDDGAVRLVDGEDVVAEARPAEVDVEVPEPVSVEAARRAAERYPWRDRHPYPTCFVCGPRRAEGDGLRIFPGPVDGRALYAAPWTPGPELAGDDGRVRPELVWAALDCPSGIVTDLLGAERSILLGRIAVAIEQPVTAGEAHVVQAWPIARDGRKLHTASAIHTADGRRCGVARATWVEARDR